MVFQGCTLFGSGPGDGLEPRGRLESIFAGERGGGGCGFFTFGDGGLGGGGGGFGEGGRGSDGAWKGRADPGCKAGEFGRCGEGWREDRFGDEPRDDAFVFGLLPRLLAVILGLDSLGTTTAATSTGTGGTAGAAASSSSFAAVAAGASSVAASTSSTFTTSSFASSFSTAAGCSCSLLLGETYAGKSTESTCSLAPSFGLSTMSTSSSFFSA